MFYVLNNKIRNLMKNVNELLIFCLYMKYILNSRQVVVTYTIYTDNSLIYFNNINLPNLTLSNLRNIIIFNNITFYLN